MISFFRSAVFIYAVLLPVSSHSIEVDLGLDPAFDIRGYLDEQVPDGLYSEYNCPENGSFSFDEKEQCKTTCQFGANIIFTLSNVKTTYFMRSAQRVAVVIDLFENNSNMKYRDTIASFDTAVSCIFTGLVPVN